MTQYPREDAVAAVYHSTEEAMSAITGLQQSGFDMKKLSIIGRDQNFADLPVGYYHVGDRMKCWGRQGTFWDDLWGMLFGSAFFSIQGFGPLLVAGPLLSSIAGALDGETSGGNANAVGYGLRHMGIPGDKILPYENAIAAGCYVVLAHVNREEKDSVPDIMDKTVTDLLETYRAC